MGNPGTTGIYDVVDDEPLKRGEVFDAMAHAARHKHLLHLPVPIMRMLMGTKHDDMSHSLRISNRRFKDVSGWEPTVSNARMGWAHLMEERSVAEPV